MVDKFKKRSFYLFNTEYEYVCRPIQKFYQLIHPQLILYKFVEKRILNTMQVFIVQNTAK